MTLPIGMTGHPLPDSARSRKRLKAIATLAAPSADLEHNGFYEGTSDEQKSKARRFLEDDKVPYHDGKTHKKPEYVVTYVDRDGGAHYSSIAPTIAQARAFLNLS